VRVRQCLSSPLLSVTGDFSSKGSKEGRKEVMLAFMSYYPGIRQQGGRETTENSCPTFQYVNVSQRRNGFTFSLVIGTSVPENCVFLAQMRPYQLFFFPCMLENL
jgi:hypothetical protein